MRDLSYGEANPDDTSGSVLDWLVGYDGEDSIITRNNGEGEQMNETLVYVISDSVDKTRKLMAPYGPSGSVGNPAVQVPITSEEDRKMYGEWIEWLNSLGYDRFNPGGNTYLSYIMEHHSVTINGDDIYVKAVNLGRKWDRFEIVYTLKHKRGRSLGPTGLRDSNNRGGSPTRLASVAAINWKETPAPGAIITKDGEWLDGEGIGGWEEKAIEYMYDLSPYEYVMSTKITKR